MNLRTGPYQDAHDASTRRGRDRILGKPRTLRALHRWLTREYGLEAPAALHTGRALEEDGDPAMTGEAKSWLGFTWPRDRSKHDWPDDWREIACRKDPDGFLATPMRCAIASIPSPERRRLLGELATNVLFPRDVLDANGVPRWAQNDVAMASLSMLWDIFVDRPLPKASVVWTEKSTSQQTAEDAA